jgi:hypothetical protein
MAKGTCSFCDRQDVAIVGRGACSACYPLFKENDNDAEKVRSYRVAHPVGSRKPREQAAPMSTKEKEIDLTAVTVSSRDTSRKISISFDLDIQISNVRINGSWPDPEPEEE